ncbi:MAG TPA: hypothetical protein VHD90_12420 [Phototrophicaceae bacterium]|nr:hypothetical protein [Phototrophicaceae bacterium]
MNDFFKKLNVLIKANLNDIGEHTAPRLRLGGRDVDDDVKTLRERVNDAVEYEDQIKANIRQLQDEAARWDQQADEAVAQDDDVNARYAIEHLQRAQQRVTMAEADLREHQRVTQELIARVNELDAAAADARRQQTTADASSTPEPAESTHLPDLSNVLRETRDKIAAMTDLAGAQNEVNPPTEAPDPGKVDADLESRRQRLSKR